MPIDLNEKYVQVLRTIFTRFPDIKEVKIFGSRAKGTARRTSDIDLAIDAPGISNALWVELYEAINEAPIAYKADLIRLDVLNNGELKTKIGLEGQTIYARH